MTTPRAALAAALDEHWLEQEVDGNPAIAACSCGRWRFDAQDGTHTVPEMGQHFYPFSQHVAAALASQGYAVTRSEAGLDVDAIVRQVVEDVIEADRNDDAMVDAEAIGNIVWENLRPLARPTAAPALDAERLALAIHAAHPHGRQLTMTDKEYDDWMAAVIAAEYARLAADPEPSDV